MNRLARLAVLALPLVGLGALWGASDHDSRQGTFWDVPVQGYDPRDLLRGHYVEFTYDWNGLDDGRAPQRICISGTPPGPPMAARVEGDFGDCRFPAEAELGSVYGTNSLVRGRLYVGQDRAREIESEMRDRDVRAVVRIRLSEAGKITPVSVSFRQLTEQELEERGPIDGPVPVLVPAPVTEIELSNQL